MRRALFLCLSCVFAVSIASSLEAQVLGTITTVAGGNGDGQPGPSVSMQFPFNLARDSAGNLYVAQLYDPIVRKIDHATGAVTTVAHLNAVAVAVDSHDNLYMGVDGGGFCVRRLDAVTGVITTVAGNGVWGADGDGGQATLASIGRPRGLAFDRFDNFYIVNEDFGLIRKVDGSGIISTFVSGFGAERVNSITFDAANNAYFTDSDNNPGYGRVWKKAADTGAETIAMYGITYPYGLAVDSAGNLYASDTLADVIYRIPTTSSDPGAWTVVAGVLTLPWATAGYNGDGIPATSALLNNQSGIVVDASNNLYIADVNNLRVRRVDASTGIITTIAGNGYFSFSGDGGLAANAQLGYNSSGTAVDTAGNLYIADSDNNRVRKVTASTGIISTIAGTGVAGYNGDNIPAVSAQLWNPTGVAVDGDGNVYIGDTYNRRVRKIDAGTGMMTTVAGGGNICDFSPSWCGADDDDAVAETAARGPHAVTVTNGWFGDGGPAIGVPMWPQSLAVDGGGNIYLTDNQNSFVRVVDVNGSFGPPGYIYSVATEGLGFLLAVTTDPAGDVFIADALNNRIVRVDAVLNTSTTIAVGARPWGIALDGAGNMFGSDLDSATVRKMDGTGTIVAGGGSAIPGDGGPATSASLWSPRDLAVRFDRLYIRDIGDRRVRSVVIPFYKTTPSLFWRSPADISASTPLGATQLNAKANVPGTFTYNPPAGTTLAVGGRALSVTFTPTDAAHYNTASATVMVNITIGTSTTALASSANPGTLGQSVTFTATVTGGATTTPTGSVSFFDGTSPLGTSSLVNGHASVSTSTLTNTSHNITAVYGGDGNFNGSTSAVLVETLSNTNTPPGSNVPSTPVDSTTGTSPVTINFGTVTSGGTTTLTTTSTGTPPPSGFKIGAPPTYYYLDTTATFTGTATLCINYSTVSYNSGNLKLMHLENGTWVDRTVSIDTTHKIICAAVTSFSPFIVVEPAATIDVVAALLTAGSAGGTQKTPLTIDIRVFDRNAVGSPDPKDFAAIWNTTTQDSSYAVSAPSQITVGGGRANDYQLQVAAANPSVPGSGSYVVIGKATVVDGGVTTDVYVGSPTDPLVAGSATQKYLQVVRSGNRK